MFYKTTYNGITLQGWNKINIIYKEHTIHNMQKNITVWFVDKDITVVNDGNSLNKTEIEQIVHFSIHLTHFFSNFITTKEIFISTIIISYINELNQNWPGSILPKTKVWTSFHYHFWLIRDNIFRFQLLTHHNKNICLPTELVEMKP